jgi:hypothetical protein
VKRTSEKLKELETELTFITKEVEQGHISPKDAADKIVHVRDEIDKVIEMMKKSPLQS